MKFHDDNWSWLESIEIVRVDGDFEDRTGAVESLVVVLGGTFDVLAGSGSWLARGVRSTPLEGKPVAMFLPPDTPFAFQSGQGDLLIIRGRQPEKPEPAGEATSKKPLLALAGSGKAFDPATGEWKRAEDFPSSPEAILPRRITVETTADCTIRRVFPFDYKALCLSLDEIVIPAGATMTVPTDPAAGYPMERAAFYETTGELQIGDRTVTGRGLLADVAEGASIRATSDCYLALAYAGPKLP